MRKFNTSGVLSREKACICSAEWLIVWKFHSEKAFQSTYNYNLKFFFEIFFFHRCLTWINFGEHIGNHLLNFYLNFLKTRENWYRNSISLACQFSFSIIYKLFFFCPANAWHIIYFFSPRNKYIRPSSAWSLLLYTFLLANKKMLFFERRGRGQAISKLSEDYEKKKGKTRELVSSPLHAGVLRGIKLRKLYCFGLCENSSVKRFDAKN